MSWELEPSDLLEVESARHKSPVLKSRKLSIDSIKSKSKESMRKSWKSNNNNNRGNL